MSTPVTIKIEGPGVMPPSTEVFGEIVSTDLDENLQVVFGDKTVTISKVLFAQEAGSPGTVIIVHPAGMEVGGQRLVVLLNGECIYFDPTDESHYDLIAGFTLNAALTGEDVQIITEGEIGSMALTQGLVYYATTNGLITSVTPSSGIFLRVGVAVSSTVLFINISQPIILV